jgi:hypothetical protein
MGIVGIFIIILLLYSIIEINMNNKRFSLDELIRLLKEKEFSEIKTKQLSGNITIVTANNLGENFLYAMKNDITSIIPVNIETINEYLKKVHIHNAIIVVKSLKNGITIEADSKAKEYNFDIVEENELIKILSQENTPILKTSDTSDDTCEIDYSQNEDPISDKPSILKKLFKGPDRL